MPTVALGGRDLDRIVVWSGAVLQKPHRALAAQRGIDPNGVFVAYFSYGSPATRYQLWAGRRIVEVDGQPTPDLDAFMRAVAGKEDRSSLRLRTVSWNGSVEVITLKLDKRYWPAYELRRTARAGRALPSNRQRASVCRCGRRVALSSDSGCSQRAGAYASLVIIRAWPSDEYCSRKSRKPSKRCAPASWWRFRPKPFTGWARTRTTRMRSVRSSASRGDPRRIP